WTKTMKASGSGRDARISESELQSQGKEFLSLLQQTMQTANGDIDGPAWRPMRDFLDALSRSRVLKGFTSDQTATFIFSFKKPLFDRLRSELGKDAETLAEETWIASEVLDRMGMLTVRAFQKTREDVINRQQQEMLELSTPVVKLWDGILALPMIGTLDSA